MSFELIDQRRGERVPIRVESSQPFDPAVLRFHYQTPRRQTPYASIGHPSDHAQSHALVTAGGGAATPDDVRKAEADREASNQLFRSVTLCAIVTLWVLLLALLCAGYYQFTGNLATARAQLLPYIGELANHTMSTLQHADETATMASDMMADGKMLSSTALPAMLDALNKSQHMVDRLERIAAHPTVKVSLGDD